MQDGQIITFPCGRTITYNQQKMFFWSEYYEETEEMFVQRVFDILPWAFVFSHDENRKYTDEELETYFFRLLDEHDEDYVYEQFFNYARFRMYLDCGIGCEYSMICCYYADEG